MKTGSPRRVFAIEPCDNFDIRPAEKFGDIVYLFPVDGQRSGLFASSLPEEIVHTLDVHRFDPAADYLLAAGTFSLVVTASAVVAAKWGNVSILLFDAQKRRYVKRGVNR